MLIIDKQSTLSTHEWKMCEQEETYLVKHSELEAKTVNKICSKSTKMAVTLLKIFR